MEPRLGVILLDSDHYRRDTGVFSPDDTQGLGCLPPGFFESPATWPVATAYAVARGARAIPTLEGRAEAVVGLWRALALLPPSCELIITDCGFFWAARRGASALPRAVLLSGLDLLDVCALMTDRPIGILTYSERHLRQLLAGHPLLERLRTVGVSELPGWRMLSHDDFVQRGGWSVNQLEAQLREVVRHAVDHGPLSGIGVLLLECTILPQFKRSLRACLRGVPVLDVASVVHATLVSGPHLVSRSSKEAV